MTKHERRTEELLQLISDELIDVVFYAALRDGSGRDGAWRKIRPYKNATEARRSEMYDELNEPRGLRKLKKIVTKFLAKLGRNHNANKEAPIDEQNT